MRAVIAESGKLVVTTRPVPSPGRNEVLVKVKATAVNRADTLQRQGKYAVPPGITDILGLEMSGEVVGQGEGAARWAQGDKVMGLLSGGGYAEYAAVDQDLLLAAPSTVSLHQAAGIPETWLTAYQLLHFVGELKEGETVVVHAAGSGVGTAATQLAVKAGAKVVATAGSDEKLAVSKSLGATTLLNYKQAKWSESVQNAHLVLDPVGGEDYSTQNLAALGVDGRWVLYGLMGGPRVPEGFPFLAKLLAKRLQLRATTLRTRSLEYRQRLVAEFARTSAPALEAGELKPIFDAKEFTLDQLQEAHEYMETNANIGKILISVA